MYRKYLFDVRRIRERQIANDKYRMVSCAYFTGLICLTANGIFDADSELRHADKRLMAHASLLLDELAERKGANSRLCQLRDAVRELGAFADVISQGRSRGDDLVDLQDLGFGGLEDGGGFGIG